MVLSVGRRDRESRDGTVIHRIAIVDALLSVDHLLLHRHDTHAICYTCAGTSGVSMSLVPAHVILD